jgi:hypothetical protein
MNAHVTQHHQSADCALAQAQAEAGRPGEARLALVRVCEYMRSRERHTHQCGVWSLYMLLQRVLGGDRAEEQQGVASESVDSTGSRSTEHYQNTASQQYIARIAAKMALQPYFRSSSSNYVRTILNHLGLITKPADSESIVNILVRIWVILPRGCA